MNGNIYIYIVLHINTIKCPQNWLEMDFSFVDKDLHLCSDNKCGINSNLHCPNVASV